MMAIIDFPKVMKDTSSTSVLIGWISHVTPQMSNPTSSMVTNPLGRSSDPQLLQFCSDQLQQDSNQLTTLNRLS